MQKYLTFDCYGTLLSESGTYDAVEKAGNEIGIDGKKARQQFHDYQEDWSLRHPYIDYDLLTRNNLIKLDYYFGLKHRFEEYYIDIMEAHRNLKPFPEVIETLQEFINRGYKLIMMSNSSWSIIPENAKALQVPFDVWIAEDVHTYKPDVKFFKTIEKEYGFTNDNHFHIAQGYDVDIVPCDQIGWDSIWVNRDNEVATTAKPTYEIHTLDEALKIVK